MLDNNPNIEEAIFEIHSDGHTWLIYENGQIKGFPDNSKIINRIKPKIDQLRGFLITQKLSPELIN